MKSYFVCGSYACEKELRRMLTPEDIRIHRIGKDLGVPTTGARRRSTAGQKERLQKGMRRSNNLHALKVGPGKARARLFTASVLASGVWGHQGQGLKPVRPRQAAAPGSQDQQTPKARLGYRRSGHAGICWGSCRRGSVPALAVDLQDPG